MCFTVPSKRDKSLDIVSFFFNLDSISEQVRDLFPYTGNNVANSLRLLVRKHRCHRFAFVFAIMFSICAIALRNLISWHRKKRAQK